MLDADDRRPPSRVFNVARLIMPGDRLRSPLLSAKDRAQSSGSLALFACADTHTATGARSSSVAVQNDKVARGPEASAAGASRAQAQCARGQRERRTTTAFKTKQRSAA